MVLSQIVNEDRGVTLFEVDGRRVPRVTIDARPQFSCTIERSPAIDGLNVDSVVRFANGNLAVTIRLLVEQVLSQANAGTVLVANVAAEAGHVRRGSAHRLRLISGRF